MPRRLPCTPAWNLSFGECASALPNTMSEKYLREKSLLSCNSAHVNFYRRRCYNTDCYLAQRCITTPEVTC